MAASRSVSDWQGVLDRIEAGEIVFLKGWEARGADLEPHGNYYLMRDDTLVAAVKLGDTWLPASTDGSELVPVDPVGLGDRPHGRPACSEWGAPHG